MEGQWHPEVLEIEVKDKGFIGIIPMQIWCHTIIKDRWKWNLIAYLKIIKLNSVFDNKWNLKVIIEKNNVEICFTE